MRALLVPCHAVTIKLCLNDPRKRAVPHATIEGKKCCSGACKNSFLNPNLQISLTQNAQVAPSSEVPKSF